MTSLHLTIGLCTYKRPQLIDTIDSIIKSELNQPTKVTILIVDNDENCSAKDAVENVDLPINMEISYVVECKRGVSNARNKVLSETVTDWLLFIDDDEVVSRCWLQSYIDLIMEKNITFKAAVGPVVTVYPDYVDKTIIRSEVLDRKKFSHREFISHGATNNCLININFIRKQAINFHQSFNLTGAEDSDFFEQIMINGGEIIWNEKAVVMESLSQERATKNWIKNRLYHNGVNYSRRMRLRYGTKVIPKLLVGGIYSVIANAAKLIIYSPISSNRLKFQCETLRGFGRLYGIIK